MPLKPKSFKYKYLFITILIIIEWKKSGQLYCEIAYHLEIPKSF